MSALVVASRLLARSSRTSAHRYLASQAVPPNQTPSSSPSDSTSPSPDPTPSSSSPPPSSPSNEPTSVESAAAQVPTKTASSLAQEVLDSSLDLPPPPRQHERFGQRTGARSASEAKSSIEKRRHIYSRVGTLLGIAGLAAGAVYLGREWDSDDERKRLVSHSEDPQSVEESDMAGWKGWWGRGKLRGMDLASQFTQPAWEELLPPPLPEPHYRPYTLVIDLDDLLIHSEWDMKNGYRTAKRPGVDYFLAYLSQFYEIVLFTTQPAYTAIPIVEKIDPYGAYIPWKIFRDGTKYSWKKQAIVKDLSYLNRPFSRTIILDTDPSLTSLQPRNAIHLAKWEGSASPPSVTSQLVGLIPFLEAIAIRNVPDVRQLIDMYGNDAGEVGKRYAEREEQLKRELREKWERDRESVGWGLRGLIKNSSAEHPPETDVERVRKQAQKIYVEEQKYWKDNEASIKKQMDEDREAQLKAMKSSLLGFMGMGPPPRPDQQPQK